MMSFRLFLFAISLFICSNSVFANNKPVAPPVDSTFYLEWGPVVMDFKRVNTDVSTAIFVSTIEVIQKMIQTPPSVKTEYARVPQNVTFLLSHNRNRQNVSSLNYSHVLKNKILQEPTASQVKELSSKLLPGDQLVITDFQTDGITFLKKIIINIKDNRGERMAVTPFSCALKWGDKTFQFIPQSGADTITWFKALGINTSDLPKNVSSLQFQYLNNPVEIKSATIGIVTDAEEKIIEVNDWGKEGVAAFNDLSKKMQSVKTMTSLYFRLIAASGESYTGALSIAGEGILILPSDTSIVNLYKPYVFNNNSLYFRNPEYSFKIGKYMSPSKVEGYQSLYNPVIMVSFADIIAMLESPVELFYQNAPIETTKYDFLRTRVLGNPKIFGINNDNTAIKETALIPKIVESLNEGDAITFKRFRTARGISDYFATFKVLTK